MAIQGRVHSVETFGTVDGPGIRYVIFMQGCPLKCVYCHNRDTWDIREGNKTTAEEILLDVKKYIDFYRSTGGGITASGGEPALQPEFVTAIFKGVKEMGLNTALDTSGYVSPEKVASILAVTDLVLLSIKAMDPSEHKALTGVTPEKIIKFAEHLKGLKKPVWIRYVLIPGINDSEKKLNSLAGFIKGLDNVKKIEILGYHKLGTQKWISCGQEDPLAHIQAADANDVARATTLLRNLGLHVG